MTRAAVLSPREAGKFIASRSKHVKVETSCVTDAAELIFNKMKKTAYSYKIWKEHEQHPKTMDGRTVDWIFVIDCLNFSFWVPEGKLDFTITHQGKNHTDYMALCAAINRAIEEGIAITSPSFYANLSFADISHVFRSATDTEMPLLQKRLECLKICGKVLCEKYGGSFINVILEANKSAKTLMEIIVENFPPFRDETVYDGQKVGLYKRAQILIADIWACFEGSSYGEFYDVDYITMFADYRVPVALQSLGLLSYSENLQQLLQNEAEIEYGNPMEVEIRGCSIEAVELLKNEIRSLVEENSDSFVRKNDINSIIIDFYLWDYATSHGDLLKRFREHRTRSIFY